MLALATPVPADDKSEHFLDDVHKAVKSGEIEPLGELLRRLQTKISGEVIDIEIEREDNIWIYEFKLVSTDGKLLEIYMDAANGEIIEVKKK